MGWRLSDPLGVCVHGSLKGLKDFKEASLLEGVQSSWSWHVGDVMSSIVLKDDKEVSSLTKRVCGSNHKFMSKL